MPMSLLKKKKRPTNDELKDILDERRRMALDMLSPLSSATKEERHKILEWSEMVSQKPWNHYNPSELADNYKEAIILYDRLDRRFDVRDTLLDKLNLELVSLQKKYSLVPDPNKEGQLIISEKCRNPSPNHSNALKKAGEILEVIHTINHFKKLDYSPKLAKDVHDALVKLRDLPPKSKQGFIHRSTELDKAVEIARKVLPIEAGEKVKLSKMDKVKRALHL